MFESPNILKTVSLDTVAWLARRSRWRGPFSGEIEMMKVLAVDDDRTMLKMLKLFLSSQGYEVLTAESGKEALEIFAKQRPGLVLTDILMPGIDGIDVLRRIKAMDSDAEVIVITGHGDMDTAIAALQSGASDFITKPIRHEALILALERAKQKTAVSQRLRDYTKNLELMVEERTRELKQAQEELIARERLATIGETVTGLAHYIKNILTGLRGGMYMVDTGMTKNKPRLIQDGWGMVRRNIEKVSDLALDLLKYSKERNPEPKLCKPNEMVSDAVELMREKAKEHNVNLNMVLDPDLKDAYLDRDGIHDMVLNLISNGIDACLYDTDTSKTWEVTVKTKLEIHAEDGETVVFAVSDNGIGMTDEVKAKLFTRFFSTKAGRGTGLGLLTAQKTIYQHGGEISVQSKPGEGTTFLVRLPRYVSVPKGLQA